MTLEDLQKKIRDKQAILRGGKVREGEEEKDFEGFEFWLEKYTKRGIKPPERDDLKEPEAVDKWYEENIAELQGKIVREEFDLKDLQIRLDIVDFVKSGKGITRNKIKTEFDFSDRETVHYIKTLRREKLIVEASGKRKGVRVFEVVEHG